MIITHYTPAIGQTTSGVVALSPSVRLLLVDVIALSDPGAHELFATALAHPLLIEAASEPSGPPKEVT